MIGVLPLQEGSSVFQTMFWSRLQVVGRPVESLMPLPVGPRHCGQFSLAMAPAAESNNDSEAASGQRGKRGFTGGPFYANERNCGGELLTKGWRRFARSWQREARKA